jgi:MOSC domain-containing protein YiiM
MPTRAPTAGPRRPCICSRSNTTTRWRRAFPEARHLHPGGLGENLSTRGITEEAGLHRRHLRLGSVHLQIAQPRTPCWKIDARCGVEGVAAHVAEHGLAGWYFRVLERANAARAMS